MNFYLVTLMTIMMWTYLSLRIHQIHRARQIR